jgi:hypothetical protein
VFELILSSPIGPAQKKSKIDAEPLKNARDLLEMIEPLEDDDELLDFFMHARLTEKSGGAAVGRNRAEGGNTIVDRNTATSSDPPLPSTATG